MPSVVLSRLIFKTNSSELSEKSAEKKEFQKHLKDAIKQGYVPEITNSREQEIYQKVLKKIK